MSSHPEIERILQQSIGLNPSSIGSPAIARAFRSRMQALGIESAEEYGRLLHRSSGEMQELIESVVVSETWFFRDNAPFTTLVDFVKTEWLPQHPSATFCALSIPCATGEEPYSIAMALMDAGVPARRFRVEAMDISARVLEHARRGIYGKNSFRSTNLDFRERYFLRIEEGYQLSQLVRDQVNFRQGNLLAYGAIDGLYDVIFCRNLLIYFDEEAQERAIAALERLLAPEGLLFLGHAEIPLLTRRGFDSSELQGAFACRRKAHSQKRSTRKPSHDLPKPRVAKISKVHPKPKLPPAVDAVPPAKPTVAKPDLDRAADLADRGELNEAAELCRVHLRSNPDSVRAHYLLGLTRDAAGKEKEAVEEYRRALYLDPNHAESLAHLAAIFEKNGDTASAGRLRARVRRIASP